MKIRDIDHVTMYVNDVDRTIRFYHETFDMPVLHQDDTHALMLCGKQALDFKLITENQSLEAKQKAAGSAAFCFIVKEQLSDVENHLRSYYIPILDGPSEHQGAHSQLTSLFINDPDGNLLEIAVEA